MSKLSQELEEAIDDLCARFLLNLPETELSSFERIFFQIEQAHWYYEDFLRPLSNNTLPTFKLRQFSLLIFENFPPLQHLVPQHATLWADFMEYKVTVPVCGAILVSENWDKVVLVKGYNKGSTWSFPRGKINKGEPESICAIREVLEETGLDITNHFRPEQLTTDFEEPPGAPDPFYIDATFREQRIRLYFIPHVPEDTVFFTSTRKEISKIAWFDIKSLVHPKKPGQLSPGRFYMVHQFIAPLRQWIKQSKQGAKAGGTVGSNGTPKKAAKKAKAVAQGAAQKAAKPTKARASPAELEDETTRLTRELNAFFFNTGGKEATAPVPVPVQGPILQVTSQDPESQPESQTESQSSASSATPIRALPRAHPSQPSAAPPIRQPPHQVPRQPSSQVSSSSERKAEKKVTFEEPDGRRTKAKQQHTPSSPTSAVPQAPQKTAGDAVGTVYINREGVITIKPTAASQTSIPPHTEQGQTLLSLLKSPPSDTPKKAQPASAGKSDVLGQTLLSLLKSPPATAVASPRNGGFSSPLGGAGSPSFGGFGSPQASGLGASSVAGFVSPAAGSLGPHATHFNSPATSSAPRPPSSSGSLSFGTLGRTHSPLTESKNENSGGFKSVSPTQSQTVQGQDLLSLLTAKSHPAARPQPPLTDAKDTQALHSDSQSSVSSSQDLLALLKAPKPNSNAGSHAASQSSSPAPVSETHAPVVSRASPAPVQPLARGSRLTPAAGQDLLALLKKPAHSGIHAESQAAPFQAEAREPSASISNQAPQPSASMPRQPPEPSSEAKTTTSNTQFAPGQDLLALLKSAGVKENRPEQPAAVPAPASLPHPTPTPRDGDLLSLLRAPAAGNGANNTAPTAKVAAASDNGTGTGANGAGRGANGAGHGTNGSVPPELRHAPPHGNGGSAAPGYDLLALLKSSPATRAVPPQTATQGAVPLNTQSHPSPGQDLLHLLKSPSANGERTLHKVESSSYEAPFTFLGSDTAPTSSAQPQNQANALLGLLAKPKSARTPPSADAHFLSDSSSVLPKQENALLNLLKTAPPPARQEPSQIPPQGNPDLLSLLKRK